MYSILGNVDLLPFNTFGISARCDYFAEIRSHEDFSALVATPLYREEEKLVLGGGSNLLFRSDFHGLVIKNELRGISVLYEDEEAAIVKAAAGEVWHDLVMWCIEKGFGGIENLSLIPGRAGAAPMQNIGAYGVELKEVFEELEAWDMHDAAKRTFSAEDCAFGYRESVFKRALKGRYLIASITLRLSKKPVLNTAYGAIRDELAKKNVNDPTIRDVSNAVISIRRSKLPDPAVMGNAGSFFKNPEVSAEKHAQLKGEFPELVAYALPAGGFKLAAGWLIEQCGLKGYEYKGAAVHSKQALVLVNRNHCAGDEVYRLSEIVQRKVMEKFGVTLEREVNIIG